MRNCKSCGQFIKNDRIHLGYKECTKCSKVEQYSAHIVYPHKTGGYVQPVSKETKEHLQGLDRRSVKKGKIGRSSSSWDRWLKQFEENKNRPKPIRKIYSAPKVDYLLTSDAMKQVMDVYDKLGYYVANDKVNELYSEDKISLIQKSTLTNKITECQMMTSKQRKWQNKL
tara:strand:- start:31 stop:540 length:510 start_codon:yes stop_codon:yes gene_type:complete